MIRKVSVLALVALMAVAAIACGSDDDHKTTPTTGATNTASATTGDSTAASTAPAPTKTSGDIILATTTSTQDSGLLDTLVPMFESETGYTIKTIAVGSGAAIQMATSGDADVLLVHSPAAEKTMVAAGDGVERTLVMHNDFIIVGPKDDPAGVKATTTSNEAMTAIATKHAKFISRGDDSGTNALELKLWKAVNIDPSGEGWYQETGQGMGATLQVADQKSGYTISDRATWLAQKKNLGGLEIVSQGDPSLLNVYHVIVVNPDKHTNTNITGARVFAAWIVRPDIQAVIGKFGVDTAGEPLFFPDAGKPEPVP